MRITPIVLSVLATVAFAGCMSDDKGEEDELPDDSGKADSQRKPIDHGAIEFGAGAPTALTDTERFHAWTFELSADADVTLTTSYALLGQRRTDTVLYLYKESVGTWGPYIARNDDYGSTVYSQLVRTLGPGRYRALVKGHKIETRGKFKLTVACEGQGCQPRDPNACLFGDVYHDITTNPALQIDNKYKVTLANLATLSARNQQLLVLAVKQSAHVDVTTPEEALDRVDQNEVNVTFFHEPAGRRSFLAFEYGAGDNSYGAMFDNTTGAMVTNIHDGDLEHCTVKPEVCLLPEDYSALRQSTAFTKTSERVITAASQLTGIEVTQAINAFQRSNPAVTTVAQGLAGVDDNRLNVVGYRHTATSADVVVFEYGAGDTSVGAIFYPGTTTYAGVISDLFIDGCSLFE